MSLQPEMRISTWTKTSLLMIRWILIFPWTWTKKWAIGAISRMIPMPWRACSTSQQLSTPIPVCRFKSDCDWNSKHKYRTGSRRLFTAQHLRHPGVGRRVLSPLRYRHESLLKPIKRTEYNELVRQPIRLASSSWGQRHRDGPSRLLHVAAWVHEYNQQQYRWECINKWEGIIDSNRLLWRVRIAWVAAIA